MLTFKNDNGNIHVLRPDCIAVVIGESKTQSRIWLTGGGSFIVHGGVEETAKLIEAARGPVEAY